MPPLFVSDYNVSVYNHYKPIEDDFLSIMIYFFTIDTFTDSNDYDVSGFSLDVQIFLLHNNRNEKAPIRSESIRDWVLNIDLHSSTVSA